MFNCIKISIFTVGCFILFVTNTAVAHPYHVSIAEMQYNSESKKLEIALRVWPGDLERSLRIMHDKQIDIDKTENIDQLITQYLDKAFQVETASKQRLKIEWVGKEVDLKHAWLYFEIPVADLTNLQFSNRICFEAERTQTNTILFKHNGQRLSLQSTQKEPTATLDLQSGKQ